jgi:UDP-N-acetylmuramoylalanine--D-glutamate ligase
MIVSRAFANEIVGVFGLARSGGACVRALKAGGANVQAWDDDEALREQARKDGARVAPFGEWPRFKALVLGPEIPPAHEVVLAARAIGAEAIGEMELFAREIRPHREGRGRAPAIAVTGAGGESRTAALIGHILSSCGFAAEIGGGGGKPALDLAPPNGRSAYVLEVSSRQIDLSPRLTPDVSVLTNIESGSTLYDHVAAKTRLLEQTAKDGQVVIGVDDALSASLYTRLSVKGAADAVPVSAGKVLGRGIFAVDGTLYDAQGQRATRVMDLAGLAGAQDWRNAALAYAAAKPLVKDARAIARAIESFAGPRATDAGRIGTAPAAPERQAS